MRFLFLIMLLLTVDVHAKEINVPMKLDYRFLHRILLEQVYTGQGNTAKPIDDKTNCKTLKLSDPQISPNEGRIRTVTAINVMFGRKIAGRCINLPEWRGFIEIFQEPVIVPGQPVIEFRVVGSNLLNQEGDKSLVTGAVWDLVMQHVHSSLERLRIDLTIPLKDIQTFVPLMLATSDTDIAHRTLESVNFFGVEATSTGIVLILQFQIPEKSTAQSIDFSTEPPLTPNEALRWESAWQRWDAFLTFVIKQVAEDNEPGDLRRELLQVLLDGRYDLTEALTSWNEGAIDPVRGLFLKSWRRLSPILRQMETTLPGTSAIRYLSFVTAADALKAMDEVSEQIGYEISADGLRRMARMLSPGFEDDPLIYRLDVDMELRRLFDFGPPLPIPIQTPDIKSRTWFFFSPAWAADKPEHDLVRKLNHWVPDDSSEIKSYLPMVGNLLDYVANKTIHNNHLPERYHDFFRNLALATAWQESCWRQFVKKGENLEPLMSPGGSVGIMQINPSVWRGFYDISALRSDISYNASAGNEILHHYLTDYVLAKGESKEKRNLDALARLTYATYSGGPGLFFRYLKSTSGDIQEVATTFWEKYHAVKINGPTAVASCYGDLTN